MKKTITILFTLSLIPLTYAKSHFSRGLASIKQETRVDHARELLGRSYRKSIVSNFEKHDGLEYKLLETVNKNLPKAFKAKSQEITEAIISESSKHGLDPYFVMAVISGESSFNPLAVGPVGEIGMMQIRPSTGEWMAKKIKFKWNGEETLRNPIQNIKLGTAYLAWLRERFNNHGQLYLAAYNMGPKSVKTALNKNIWPKDYPKHVMKRYIAFYKEI